MLLVSSDRRPLRGIAGMVDWRLCGELSSALQGGSVQGQVGERILMSTRKRIGATRLLIYGVGPSSRPVGAAELGTLLESARAAGADALALELPEAVTAEAAAEALNGFRGERLIVLGAPAALVERLGKSGRG